MTDDRLRLLFCPDLTLLKEPAQKAWILSFVRYLNDSGVELTVLLNDHRATEIAADLEDQADDLILRIASHGSEDSHLSEPRFHARAVIAQAIEGRQILYDAVITQGLSLSRYVAGSKKLQPAHWAILDDNPLQTSDPRGLDQRELEIVAKSAKLVLTHFPTTRSFIESRYPAATAKTRLLTSPRLKLLPGITKGEPLPVLDFKSFGPHWELHDFTTAIQEARSLKNPPEMAIIEDPSNSSGYGNELLSSYPGARSANDLDSINGQRPRLYLVPLGVPEQSLAHALAPLRPGDLVKTASDYTIRLEDLSTVGASHPEIPNRNFLVDFSQDLPDYARTPHRDGPPVRVLLAGADFKFAGELVDALIQRSDVSFSVDLFEANAKPQPAKSNAALRTADVIIAEFASRNAIWYSQNVRSNQRLIVHLHGYELLQDWITELRVENCDAIVVASNFYRDKAIEMRGWPPEKIIVIPNSVNFGDLSRPKHEDARFHLGLVGIVPILKRPDRAIDLLERLVGIDERFVLHIRGHAPWNYAWEWKKSAHQDAYRRFYSEIGARPELHRHIAFESFGPDMGNWLQDIGWLLSPSTRETFHLSAIEGAASGAVPVAWRREGSEEIIGEAFNVDSVDEAANFISTHALTLGDFERVSAKARQHAQRYGSENVRALWLDLIFKLSDQAHSSFVPCSEETSVLERVDAAWLSEDPETAVAILDENIPLTRDNRGELKDAEMFFRGIASADEKRFTQFLPLSKTENSAEGSTAMIRPTGASFDGAESNAVIDTFVGVTPPRYVSRLGYEPLSYSRVRLPAPNNYEITLNGFYRLDRWFESVKVRLMPVALRHAVFAVQGPWWVALPALQAADQAGIPCAWFIDDEETLQWIGRAWQGDLGTHFAAQIALNCFKRASARTVLANVRLPDGFPTELLDSVVLECDDSYELESLSRWEPNCLLDNRVSSSLEYVNAPTVIQKDLASLRIGTIANSEFNSSISDFVHTLELLEDDFMSQIDAELDIVLVHGSADSTPCWKDKLSSASISAQTPTAKLLDRARLLGAITCFIWDLPAPLPKNLWATARKADAIAATDPDSLRRFLELNPSAVRALAPWDLQLPLRERLTLALRSAYFPVTLERALSLSETQENEHNFDTRITEYDVEELPPLERIAVFTDDTKANWDAQTLPHSLFQLYPKSELNQREALSDELFVISPDTAPADKDYLLDLWINGPLRSDAHDEVKPDVLYRK
ncbi:glycosyltransferase family 4 protein [Corynebacterium sp. 20_84]